MAVEVQSFSITKQDYKDLKKYYFCSFLKLLPEFSFDNNDKVELFLTENELQDIQEFLDTVRTK